MNKKNIVFISSGKPHPNSIVFANAVNADIYAIKKKQYDWILKSIYESIKLWFKLPWWTKYYIIESTLSIIPILIRRYLFLENNKIIHRANAYEYDLLVKKRWSKLERIVSKYLLSKVSYCIAISKIIKKQILTIFPKREIDIIYTTIYDNEYFSLTHMPENERFIFIGNYNKQYDYKGIKTLIKYFQGFNKEYKKQLKLDIIWRDTSILKKYISDKNIKTHGFVNPKPFLQKAKFYIHNAEIEAGGTSVLEAMGMGIIPIITDTTWNKDILEKEWLNEMIYRYGNYKDFKRVLEYVLNINEKDYTKISEYIKKIVYKNSSLEKVEKKIKERIFYFVNNNEWIQ